MPAGLGTALKPAVEPIVLARKPLAASTVAANVLAHGTGALHIDACRVGTQPAYVDRVRGPRSALINQLNGPGTRSSGGAGRWPPNTLFSHVGGPDGCQPAGVRRVRGSGDPARFQKTTGGWASAPYGNQMAGAYADAEGYESVDAWACHPQCPIRVLDEQAGSCPSKAGGSSPTSGFWGQAGGCEGVRRDDTGGPSRFFPRFGWVDGDDSFPYNEGGDSGADQCQRTTRCVISARARGAGIGAGANRAVASTTANLSHGGSGSATTAPSQRATRSITKTRTPLTTPSRTLNASPETGTPSTTGASDGIIASSPEAKNGAARHATNTSPSPSSGSVKPAPIRATAKRAPWPNGGNGKSSTAPPITPTDVPTTPSTSPSMSHAPARLVVSPLRRTTPRASTAQIAAATPHPTDAHIHLPADDAVQTSRSRFFPTFGPDPADAVPFRYQPKAPPSERRLADGTPTVHPTQKPVALACWLASLVCRPGGTILDPFAGVGSLGIGALRAGCHYLGIEQDAAYAAVAQRRLDEEQEQRTGPLFACVGTSGAAR